MIDDQETVLMIEDCMNRKSKLTEWEQEFIQSLSEQTYTITATQYARLEKIWERIT